MNAHALGCSTATWPTRHEQRFESQHICPISGHSTADFAVHTPSSTVPASPQQKVVYVLVNRLKNKLPCNSGIALAELEADDAIQQAVETLVDLARDSLDVIAWALTELLEKLAKQIDSSGFRSTDILQSQLFLLKVLSICMASRWGIIEDIRPNSRESKAQPNTIGSKPHTPDSPAMSHNRRRQVSSEQLSTTLTTPVEPAPIDDNCARYMLSVMVLFLRQTAPLKHRLMSAANMNFDASFQDFESVESHEVGQAVGGLFSAGPDEPPPVISGIPKNMRRSKHASSNSLNSKIVSSASMDQYSRHSLVYEKTSTLVSKSVLSLNTAIAKFSGRIIYHLSASNWPVVLSRIRNKIYTLASTTETDPDIVDLQLMTHCALDRARLVQSLQELSSLLVNMKREAQVAIANISARRSAPERVFDVLSELGEHANKAGVWPTLAVLLCISSDRMKSEFQVSTFGAPKGPHGRKDRNFTELIIKNMAFPSKHADVAVICALDICRAASRVRPAEGEEVPLPSMALDIAHEIKLVLLKWNNSRPVWESPEEIDVAMIADALVTIFRFLPEEESIPMFETCLEAERSDAVKISVVKACITLVVDANRLPWQRNLGNLKNAVMQRLTRIHLSSTTRRSEVGAGGVSKKANFRPKAKRYTSETLADRELLLLSILTLWRADVWWFHDCVDLEQKSSWVKEWLEIWHAPADPAVRFSLARTFRHLVENVAQMSADHPRFAVLSMWQSVVGPATLAAVCTNLLNARSDYPAQRMWISMAYEIMFRFTRPYEVHKDIQVAADRVPAFALAEIAFLVSLASADCVVSLTACNCLRMIAMAERQPGAPVMAALSEDERTKRHPIYEQLGDPKVTVIGRVGHQKRIRKLMRLLAFPSEIHVAVWNEMYWRWCTFNELTIRMSMDQTSDGFDSGLAPIGEFSISTEEKQAQWQALTLLLSAFGAACTRESHDPAALTTVITPCYIPDELRNLRDPSELLSAYLAETVNLLVSDSPQVRDVAREALSNEASPRLYSKILKNLDSVIHQITDGEHVDYEILVVFLDQFIAILKVVAENVHNLTEELRGIDITSTLLTLAAFIGRFHDISSYQPIIMRKDNSTRQSIVDIVIGWVQESPESDGRSLLHSPHELNVAVLRTSVKLFDRLQLEPSEGASEEEAAHVVSRLFIRYSTFLVKTWDATRSDILNKDDGTSDRSSTFYQLRVMQRDGELRELTIAGLASLIGANTEVGVKHCLYLAYDPDPTKRMIFAHIFVRVLGQGIKFSTHDASPITNGQSPLCELIKSQDVSLAMAICEICPPTEVDSIISVMLNIFDTRSSLLNLLKSMIDREISRTDADTSLFRGNTICTRFLSAFAKIYGNCRNAGGTWYELDPSKVSEKELKQNKETVEFVAASFLEIIGSSVPAIPSIIREICSHIAKAVNGVWPEAKFAALGAFIFLRFISPAVVSPETVDVEVPADLIARRGLMTIAKIIQNLANNILFGKEWHMTILNDFLKANIVNVTQFLSEINKYSPPVSDEEPDEWLDRTYDDTDTIVLHRFFEKHADKIGKELLSSSKIAPEKVTPEAEAAAAQGKRAWDALCSTLVELGQPLESPIVTTLSSREHQEFLDLMARCDRRDTGSVQELFTEAAIPTDGLAVFILSVSKVDVEVLDVELLLYYIFKLLTSPAHESRPYDIVFDFTGFTSTSQVPAQWWKFAQETIPSDVRDRLRHMRILTPNALAMRYIRKLYYNLIPEPATSTRIAVHTTVEELLSHYPSGTTMSALAYAVSLEHEDLDQFQDVTMRHNHPMRAPVILRVAQSHLRIITIRHGVTLYFSSPARDIIVKTIRAAKSTMRPAQLPATERSSRLSNIVTTLLHVAFLGISSEQDEPRTPSFELLSAICTYLDYEGKPPVPSKGVYATGHPGAFLVQVSEGLAGFAPQLTMDFLSEMAGGINKLGVPLRALSLQYMGPWIKNLTYFVDPTHKLYEPSGAKFRDCVRSLIDITMSEHDLHGLVQKFIWTEVGKLDTVAVNIVLDELMRAAVDGGWDPQDARRILARIRKVISKTSAKPSKNLAENPQWNEIACLTRLVLVVGNTARNTVQSQLFVPEIMHLVTLVAATGQTYVRGTVYAIVTHMLHALYSLRLGDTSTVSPEIQVLIDECVQPDTIKLFGLAKPTPTSDFVCYDYPNDKALIDGLEGLTRLLVRIMETISGTRGLLNVWRARWMSLITSSAFQLSPAVQTRAFVTLGILATSDVDDDLLYQMLVAFKTALSQSSEDDTTSVVSMLRCITNVVPASPPQSRYLPQIFWLSVALLQSGNISLYVEAIQLLRVTLEYLAEHDIFKDRGVPATLLEARVPLEDIAGQVDQLLGLSFDSSFSFSLASIIFKGMRHPGLKDSAEAALRSLLRITVDSCSEVDHADEGPDRPLCQDAIGYFLALLPSSTTKRGFRQLQEESRLDASWLTREELASQDEEDHVLRLPFGIIGYVDNNTALFVTSFVAAMLTTAQGDDAESSILYNILSVVADAYADVIAITYESLQDKMRDKFANSSSPHILRAVSNIFRIAINEIERSGVPPPPPRAAASASTLSAAEEGISTASVNGPGAKHLSALEEQGMSGLVNSFQFLPANNKGHATKMINWISELVMKIIEVG
ncbi:Neurofibromin [Grifola frondosa]|uniref:Neurofibromin n=1 Tax=Grifola frondosa TaxID=5627 RepID=A0A1C7M0G2_GRIFR|nr:Neurofibromin [Grifola frondosa]